MPIVIGTLDEQTLPVLCSSSDPRLSDARTPTAHTHVIADITDYEEGGGGPHNTTHHNGGSDELNVGGLSGVLADPQTPIAHAAQHLTGGNDVIANAGANAGLMSAGDKTKLDGVASGATANDTDANLKNRATHTGSQAQSTITNLTSDLANKSDTSHTHSLSAAWPIGSVFISVVSTNPATLLGFGSWSAFAAGRVLVGIDAGQTEFDALEETGGSKTHQLTANEMPAHTHVVTSQTATTGSATSYEHGVLDTSSAEAEATEVTGSTGGGGAHNNLQPFVIVSMWKRTA